MNQTDRFDEIFRRGKGLLDFMDELIKYDPLKDDLDTQADLLIEHERLREAVIEAADSWEQRIDNQYVTIYERHDHYKRLRVAIVALRDFERGIKEQS